MGQTWIEKLHQHFYFSLQKRKALETGFSMLEAVVVVGVLLALAVGGLFAYGPIVQNAKLAKVKSAASDVFTAVTVAQIDGDPSTTAIDVVDSFNSSNDKIKVTLKAAVLPAMSTDRFIPTSDNDFCVVAEIIGEPEIYSEKGNCAVNETAPPTKDETVPALKTLKNGDFSSGLSYWDAKGNGKLTYPANEKAVFEPGPHLRGSLLQNIDIPKDGITHLKYTYSATTGYSVGYDKPAFTVNVYNPAITSSEISKSHSLINRNAIPDTESTLDLSKFAGQNITLGFTYFNDTDLARTVYLDDVSVQTTTTAPGSPTNVKIAINDTDATINWTAPVSGQNSITSYKVTPYQNDAPLTPIVVSGEPPVTTALFKGLSNGKNYKFTVTATNSIGDSVASIPSESYLKPQKELLNGDFSNGLTYWQASGNGVLPTVSSEQAVFSLGKRTVGSLLQTVFIPQEGVTYLRYTYGASTGYSIGYDKPALSVNVYSAAGVLLKAAKIHSLTDRNVIPATVSTVALSEFAGQDIKLMFIDNNDSDYARTLWLDDISVQNTKDAPGAPSSVQFTVNDTDATINWSAPSNGENSITSYVVTPYRNGTPLTPIVITGEPPVTTALFKGLSSGGTYKFAVAAKNKIGTSALTESSNSFQMLDKKLQNGDFANGLTAWTATGNGKLPYVANEKAVFEPGTRRVGSITQTVTIPKTGVTQLKYTYSATSGYSVGYDKPALSVNVYSAAGTLIKTVKTHSLTDRNVIPATVSTVDLSEFAGQDIKLVFTDNNDTDVARTVYLDDISVQTS